MKQLTLVSFYGQKQEPLARLIRDCTTMIQNSPLVRIFRPYYPDQVHGTIVGMEKLESEAELFNKNAWLVSGAKKVMDFYRLQPTLQEHLPMTVQFGGFSPAFNRFRSSGLPPYQRAFQVQWQAGRFTIIGWPHSNGEFASRQLLNELRKDLYAHCNIKHKWGADNDLYMVLGETANTELLSGKELAEIKRALPALESAIRDYLAGHKTEVVMSMEDIYVVQYEAESLEPNSTVPYRITGLEVDMNFMRNLYE